VNAAVEQRLHVGDLALRRLVRLRQDHIIPCTVSDVLYTTDNRGEKEVNNFGNDNTQRVGLTFSQAECDDVGLVIQFFRQFIDGAFGFRTDVRMMFERAGYRRGRNDQLLVNILDVNLIVSRSSFQLALVTSVKLPSRPGSCLSALVTPQSNEFRPIYVADYSNWSQMLQRSNYPYTRIGCHPLISRSGSL